MARKRRRDFWDDIDDDLMMEEEPKYTNQSIIYDEEYAEPEIENEGFKLTKCTPVKVFARLLLFVAAVVVGLSGYVCYKYVSDRYNDGSYSTSYFDSNGFSEEYNDSVTHLLKLIQAVEAEDELTPERTAEMIASIMGTNSNFSFFIMNENQERVLVSGEDAKDRIESSNHFLQINTLDNAFDVVSGVPTSGLNKTAWKSALDECINAYNIYTAVDNNLTQEDSYYESYLEYQKMTEYFDLAKIAGIIGLVVFIVLLIYCVMATGMRRGYEGVSLTIFDKVFTEIAAIIIIAVLGGLIYGLYYLSGSDLKYALYLQIADILVLYILAIRGYFSLVRRIKSGTFITNSLIYKLCHGINMALNHLPKALKVIIIVLLLVALNGALVYALLYLRDITVKDIPVIFVVAPVVFIIELIGFISCIFGVGDDEYYYEDEDDYEDDLAEDAQELPMNESNEAIAEVGSENDWEEMDFADSIKASDVGTYEDHSLNAATQVNTATRVSDKTVILSDEERQKVLDSLGLGTGILPKLNLEPEPSEAVEEKVEEPAAVEESVKAPETETPVEEAAETPEETATEEVVEEMVEVIPEAVEETVKADEEELDYVDFIQLNKDVRKTFRLKLKARSIGVTLRAPEKPILLDIDKANAVKLLSLLFDNIYKFAQEESRVYIEMYSQNGKMIYLMKNTISEDIIGKTTTELGDGLNEAKRIVLAEKGKFINSIEGDMYKVGILLDVAPEK